MSNPQIHSEGPKQPVQSLSPSPLKSLTSPLKKSPLASLAPVSAPLEHLPQSFQRVKQTQERRNAFDQSGLQKQLESSIEHTSPESMRERYQQMPMLSLFHGFLPDI